MFNSARSHHSGIANVCRADGSVDAINEDINVLVYNAMGSRCWLAQLPWVRSW